MIARQVVWPYPRLFAHRCGGVLAPENTLAGLHTAARLGVPGVEFDVMLSADGTPLLIHDETWERTTDGAGRVADTHDDQLARLDAGTRFDAAFAGERVPTLEMAARLCLELELAANVEIKPAAGYEALTGRIVAAASAQLWSGAALPPLLSSFSEPALQAAREAAPRLARGFLVGAIPEDWRERMARLECLSMHCDSRSNSLPQLGAIAADGVPIVCYTVNDQLEARRLLAVGVVAVITDCIDAVTVSPGG